MTYIYVIRVPYNFRGPIVICESHVIYVLFDFFRVHMGEKKALPFKHLCP